MRFVTNGEALIDLLPAAVQPPAGDDPRLAHLSTTWTALSAGGPMTTAVALARLGENVEFLGRFGGDSFAAQLRRYLSDNGVGLSLARNTDEATSMAIVSLDDQGRASYTFHFDKTANFGWSLEEFPVLNADDWLHFGSLVSVLEPGADALLQFVQQTPASLSFDLNVRPSAIPDPNVYWQRVEPFLQTLGDHAGVLRASDEDIAFLTGGVDDADFDPVQVAADWTSVYGLRLALVTLGGDGAAAVKPDGHVTRVPGRRITLIDTVGAGDTFMAGFLSAYVADPSDLTSALTHATVAAGITCERRGANPPTRAELEAALAN